MVDDAQEQKNEVNQQWGGRFNEGVDQFVAAFTASIDFDKILAPHDIQASIAHARMLGDTGILTVQEAEQIVSGLEAIALDIASGTIKWRQDLEDVHMNIEALLTTRIGSAGKKLHTGRSRNDQVATDIRLYLRAQMDEIGALITQLQKALVRVAQKEAATIMPGFTHLQNAQPITFGHHLMAWNAMLERDWARLRDCRHRVNHCPLGAAALAGTSYPIDRQKTATALGFAEPMTNSLDAVSDRDFALEFCAAGTIMMTHFSRMSEELVLWSCPQFDFIELPDRFCTGSSIMPQKKNPDVPELIRGKTGRMQGNLINLVTLMKSQPLAYNKDNQEDKEPLFDSVKTLKQVITAFVLMVPHIKVKRKNLYAAAKKGFTTATDFADYLVQKGLTFRDAHEIVGQVVRHCIEHQLPLEALSTKTLQDFCAVVTEDVHERLTLEGSVSARNHLGGTAPEQVKKAAAQSLALLDQRQAGLDM